MRDERAIGRAPDIECAPESKAIEEIEPAFDDEPIAEFRGTFIIDFSANHDRVMSAFGHPGETHAELFRENRAGDLDETEVVDIVHDGSAVGIEKHDLHVGGNAGNLELAHGGGDYRRDILKIESEKSAVPGRLPLGREACSKFVP